MKAVGPLVSVIIPVYQAEDYIESCINSLVKQSYDDLEIILVDDGSTDSSLNKCQAYAAFSKKIVVLRQNNQGASAARNKGLEYCHGQYIFFMDADDWIVENAISSMVEVMKKNNDLVFFDYYKKDLTNSTSSFIGKTERLSQEESVKRMLDVQVVDNDINGYLWNKLFVASIIKENNLRFNSKLKMWEDLLFCMQYVNFVNGASYLHEKLYLYTDRNSSSISRAISAEAAYTWIKAGQQVNKIVASKFSKQYEDFNEHLINIYMTYIVISIRQDKKIRDYNELIVLLRNNRKKLRKKYRLFLLCLKVNYRVGRFLVRIWR